MREIKSSPVRLLIVSKQQFGYLTDTLKYVEHLSDRFEITYVCLDQGVAKRSSSRSRVIYVSSSTVLGKIGRTLGLISTARRLSRSADCIFIVQFPGASLLRLTLPGRRTVLDIRSRSVRQTRIIRFFQDALIQLDAFLFPNVTCVSSQIAWHFHRTDATILPLGADPPTGQTAYHPTSQEQSAVCLLYVGAIAGRNIETVLEGFHLLLKRGAHATLRIVGGKVRAELDPLRTKIEELKLQEAVTLTGFLHDDALKAEFEAADIGIVHVPMAVHFAGQPSTKLLEYYASGLPVLATATEMNAELVFADTGCLYADNPQSFAESAEVLISNLSRINWSRISDIAAHNTWLQIVAEKVEPLLLQIGLNPPPSGISPSMKT